MVKRPDRKNRTSAENREKEKRKKEQERRKKVRTRKGFYNDRMLKPSKIWG